MVNRVSVVILPVFVLFFTLLPVYGMADDMPKSPAGGGFLDLHGGRQGYYFAEDVDDCFDNELLKNGMTVEFWFCPARLTERREWCNLVFKRHLYGIYVEHWYTIDPLPDQPDRKVKNEWVCLRVGSVGGSSARGIWDIRAGEDYEPTWYHVVWQGRLIGNCFHGVTYMNGVSSGSRISCSSPLVVDSDHPLYVGGLPEGARTWIHDGEDTVMSDATTFDGLIDELRISSIERYEVKPLGEEIKIKELFRTDEHTVALWHFEEGPGTLEYKDASGNDHTLFATGQFAVTPKHKVPSLWGAIKEQRK